MTHNTHPTKTRRFFFFFCIQNPFFKTKVQTKFMKSCCCMDVAQALLHAYSPCLCSAKVTAWEVHVNALLSLRVCTHPSLSGAKSALESIHWATKVTQRISWAAQAVLWILTNPCTLELSSQECPSRAGLWIQTSRPHLQPERNQMASAGKAASRLRVLKLGKPSSETWLTLGPVANLCTLLAEVLHSSHAEWPSSLLQTGPARLPSPSPRAPALVQHCLVCLLPPGAVACTRLGGLWSRAGAALAEGVTEGPELWGWQPFIINHRRGQRCGHLLPGAKGRFRCRARTASGVISVHVVLHFSLALSFRFLCCYIYTYIFNRWIRKSLKQLLCRLGSFVYIHKK